MRKLYLKVAAAVLAAAAAALIAAMQTPQGVQARDRFYTNRHCCDLSTARALMVTFDETVRRQRFPSQIGQDKWVLFRMFPGVSGGYFVDIGSADGTIGSNTKALEERGWRGLCVDPFPTNMDGRTCQVFKDVVWSVPGHKVQFHTHGELGGVSQTLGAWKDVVTTSPTVELSTVTLADILERGKAPSYIHFMSLDIEGAELEALRGLPFEKYRFGAMAIEHNEEEPKRSDIIKFLAGRGYERVFTRLQDDFFAPVERP